jgi:lipoprotein-anchoring transpeptidase ErfK/SrfK
LSYVEYQQTDLLRGSDGIIVLFTYPRTADVHVVRAAPANANCATRRLASFPAIGVRARRAERKRATAGAPAAAARKIPEPRGAGHHHYRYPNTFLYYVLGHGKAIRYGIGVGREGFTWSGVKNVARKAEWPDWYPPAQMIVRQPYLPRMVAGGPGNPLGARAIYIGGTEFRIHGTNDPMSIGKQVSSGCIRLTNDDLIDLYDRVTLGAKVIVLSM